MIKSEIIDKVREVANIVEVIEDFVELKPSGQNFKGLSPFVQERKPSFFVSPSKNIFKCFKSEVGGDAVKFLMEKEKLSFIDAIRYLASKYNVDLEEDVKTKTFEEDKKLSDLPSVLFEIERLSSQLAGHDSSKLSPEIEQVKTRLLYYKDQKFKLVKQLSTVSFEALRKGLNDADLEFRTVKKQYDEVANGDKKSLSETLTLKSNRMREIRGLIAFKHLLQ